MNQINTEIPEINSPEITHVGTAAWMAALLAGVKLAVREDFCSVPALVAHWPDSEKDGDGAGQFLARPAQPSGHEGAGGDLARFTVGGVSFLRAPLQETSSQSGGALFGALTPAAKNLAAKWLSVVTEAWAEQWVKDGGVEAAEVHAITGIEEELRRHEAESGEEDNFGLSERERRFAEAAGPGEQASPDGEENRKPGPHEKPEPGDEPREGQSFVAGPEQIAEPNWRVPTKERSGPRGGTLLDTGGLQAPILVIGRGKKGYEVPEDGWARLTHLEGQLYAKKIAPLLACGFCEILAVSLADGRRRTLWADGDANVKYPKPLTSEEREAYKRACGHYPKPK